MLREPMRALRLRFQQKPTRLQPRPTGVAVLGFESQTRLVSTQTLAKRERERERERESHREVSGSTPAGREESLADACG